MDHSDLDEGNKRLLEEIRRRRPQDAAHYERRLAKLASAPALEGLAGAAPTFNIVLETIVSEDRPVLFAKAGKIDFDDIPSLGPEGTELREAMQARAAPLTSLLSLVGRIDVVEFPGGLDYLGTGWFIDEGIVVTNRHVAEHIAHWNGREFVFSRGVGGRDIASSLCIARQKGDGALDPASVFAVERVLYIEPPNGEHDIAFLAVKQRSDGATPKRIEIAPEDPAAAARVCVIGYPAEGDALAIPDQALMHRLYGRQYKIKRLAPGLTKTPEGSSGRHDCTTLGGNSGSVVLDIATAKAVGLHYAGLWRSANYAVPASVLVRYRDNRIWSRPPNVGEIVKPAGPADAAAVAPAGAPAAPLTTVTIPLTVTLTVGAPTVSGAAVAPGSSSKEAASKAASDYWCGRPAGVVASRVGFFEDGDRIGDTPCIAVSVLPDRLAEFERSGPRHFQGFAIRYDAATTREQIEALPQVEAAGSVAYDDDNRSGEEFSFETVNEPMEVRAHVGPEYSWDELGAFLAGVKADLVSGIYEFHGPHIRDAIGARLLEGVAVRMVIDNATMSGDGETETEFDRARTFEGWRDTHKDRFHAIVAKEGTKGLIANAYHIKVSVREDDKFWLSSGNWKLTSSQPIVTQAMRDNAPNKDLPGNREWHVIVRNKTLAGRLRAHIVQDFARSRELHGAIIAEGAQAGMLVDVPIPIAEGLVPERRPPERVLEPLAIERKVRVRPLLTPDRQGAVYSEAVLELMRSARRSLLFQIPYIGMPPHPGADRGFIDELIGVLTEKLRTLDDARLLLRSGGSKLSSPTHAAWHFKSQGVDIDARVRQMEHHHTKGMVVDGKSVLVGSHNWSKDGVSLNRDASLIFHDPEIAGYYARAFQIDWDRSNPIKPKKFVKPEMPLLPAQGAQPPPGYRRMRLSEVMAEES